jgi:hypothetical protein
MVPTQDDLATRTEELPFRQRHLLPVSALRAVLGRIRRVDLHEPSTGTCCLEEQQREEQRPGRIDDGLRHAAIVDHPVNFQVFDRDNTESVHEATGALVGEVQAPERNPLVDAGYRLAPLGPFRCSLRHFAETTLGFRQGLLSGAEESRVLNCFARGDCGEGMQPDIDTNCSIVLGQRLRRLDLAREASVPLARTAPLDDAGLGSAYKRTMENNLDGTNLGEL